MRKQSRRRAQHDGPFAVLRDLSRKLKQQQNHPHYVGNGNESLRLDQVIQASPPEGGLVAYLRDLDRS